MRLFHPRAFPLRVMLSEVVLMMIAMFLFKKHFEDLNPNKPLEIYFHAVFYFYMVKTLSFFIYFE